MYNAMIHHLMCGSIMLRRVLRADGFGILRICKPGLHVGYNLTQCDKNAILLLKLGKYDNLLGVLDFVHVESQI